jgi:transcriptional regulator with GAF, ATPase, and Fis domain
MSQISVAELEAENARLRRELAEALEQQTAASEVLRVISSSPGELHSVFQPMLANAIKLCEARYGAMWLRQGDSFRNAAIHGPLPAEYVEIWRSATAPMGSAVLLGPLAQSRKPVHVADLRETREYRDGYQLAVTAADTAGIRTIVGVPMLKNDDLIGAIIIYRQEVRPSPISKSRWSRTSPPRPSSRSRTRAFSTNCANRCSSRPPPPTCSRTFARGGFLQRVA